MTKFVKSFITGLAIAFITLAALTAFPPTSNAALVELPPLPYDYAALAPSIDAETMQLHHDKHHATYVTNLNAVLEKYPDLQKQSVEALLKNLNQVPEAVRKTVQNNGGGHVNHTMFWTIMKPNSGGKPTGTLATAIQKTFGSYEAFQEEFSQAGLSQFGSGWVWLVSNPQKQLKIITTANQDSPLMQGMYPVMGNDLWEHAYYLTYRNRRADYLKSWWNVVDWAAIEQRYVNAGRAGY
jgi:superoxide dismutase, Fe-Mn family